MAEKQELKFAEGTSEETFTYKARSYDRLKSEEEELFELIKLSEVPIDKELFKVILELLKLNIAPAAVLQVLKSLRSQNTPDDFGSRSPAGRRSGSSSQHHTPPPSSSESSTSQLPSALPISDFTSSGELTGHGHSVTPHDNLTQSDGAEQSKGSRSRSGNRHRSHDHKHKSRSGSTGRKHPRDPTGGSAKLKIKEKTDRNSS